MFDREAMMSTHKLMIEGMTCNGCANRVAKALKDFPGVVDARVSLADGMAEVVADGPIDPSLLAATVGKRGYRATVAS